MFRLLLILLLTLGCYVDPIQERNTYVEYNKSMGLMAKYGMEIFYQGEPVPDNYSIIGDIFVGHGAEAGFVECSYYDTLNEALEKAKSLKGNAIKITDLKEPTAGYGCYRIYALVLVSDK